MSASVDGEERPTSVASWLDADASSPRLPLFRAVSLGSSILSYAARISPITTKTLSKNHLQTRRGPALSIAGLGRLLSSYPKVNAGGATASFTAPSYSAPVADATAAVNSATTAVTDAVNQTAPAATTVSVLDQRRPTSIRAGFIASVARNRLNHVVLGPVSLESDIGWSL
jgi:hypothetical protein